jgi:transglutaminase-like putative cysteine protease
MRGLVAFLIGGILLPCGAIASAAERSKSQQTGPHAVARTEQKVAVVFTVRVIHNGTKPLQDPQIRMRLPLALPQQDIDAVDVEGRPRREFDRWHEPVLVYWRSGLPSGGMLTGRWSAECRIRELQWNLRGTVPIFAPAKMGRSPSTALSPEEKAAYLRDAKPFAVKDPAIQRAARQATAGRGDDVAKLEGIHDFVIAHLRYSRDGRWDPAPVVLASGKGSCSEYTYLFVALCRAAGIPARYVGGITGRAGKPLHVDLVYHRFAQAFVEGIGWVDFDPTRDRRSKSHRLYFGRTPGPLLLLCAGDGRGSLTGWDYRSRILWKGKGEDEDDDSPRAPNYAATAVVQVGWWLPQPAAEIRQKVAAFRKRLAETPASQRRSLIAEALKIDHPYVLPWLDDLLYDPATRVEAARAFLKIGGKDAFLAVVDNLCRQNDRDGDRQIGELLDRSTGEHFGSDRKQWKKWLGSHTPPVAAVPAAQSR